MRHLRNFNENVNSKNKYFLIKLCFDTNDADYVYGIDVLDEKEMEIVNQNLNKKVTFFQTDSYVPLKECISIQEIKPEQAKCLIDLGLKNFGECHQEWINYLDESEDEDYEDESEDEDYEDESEDDPEIHVDNRKVKLLTKEEKIILFTDFLKDIKKYEDFVKLFPRKVNLRIIETIEEYFDFCANYPQMFVFHILKDKFNPKNDTEWFPVAEKWQEKLNDINNGL